MQIFKKNKLPKLTVELVPQGCWYSNLRTKLPVGQWDILRKMQYVKAGYVCEVCGGRGPQWPVECHEIWEYDDRTHVQKLAGLIALCPTCHQVKHIGFAGISGHTGEAIAHLMAVNEWSRREADKYLAKMWATWSERSQHVWTTDLSLLDSLLSGQVDKP